jgi:hypothetical protein
MNKGFLILIFTVLIGSNIFAQVKGVVFDKSIHDFGAIEEGVRPNFDFNFESLSKDSVHLTSVKPGCGCTSPFWTKDPVAPGEIGSIKVSYNSNHRIGMFNKPVTVTTADGAQSIIRIRGVVHPKPVEDSLSQNNNSVPKLSRTFYDYGIVELNRPYTANIAIENSGTDTLRILKIESGCRCVSMTVDRKNGVPEGKEANLRIVYRPSDLAEKEIIAVVFTNSTKEPIIELKLKSNVVKSLIQPSLLQSSPGFGF